MLKGGRFGLHDAVDEGDIEKCRSLLHPSDDDDDDNNNNINDDDDDDDDDDEDFNSSMSSIAAIEGVSIADALTLRDVNGCTPLHLALLNGHIDIMEALLDPCLPVSSVCKSVSLRIEHSWPIHIALSTSSLIGSTSSFAVAAMRCIFRLSPKQVMACDDERRTPLHLAALYGFVDVIHELFEPSFFNNVNINAQDIHGRTPLHLAAMRGHIIVIGLLLEKGADPSIADYSCRALPLHLASKREVFELLLSRGVNTSDLHGVIAVCPINSSGSKKTLIVTDADFVTCHVTSMSLKSRLRAHSSPPPPENANRVAVLVDEHFGSLMARDIQGFVEWQRISRPAHLVDVLRVHEYSYIRRVISACEAIPENSVGSLDADTVISGDSYAAALKAAGAVIAAVDAVVRGTHANAFCAVRPPGHHAGAMGKVVCSNSPDGSHGFCLLNNVAIGAAYARCVHRDAGIRRVLIFDFDVHHGNGTEDIISNLKPNKRVFPVNANGGVVLGDLSTTVFKPWLDAESDAEEILFVSTHGYGLTGGNDSDSSENEEMGPMDERCTLASMVDGGDRINGEGDPSMPWFYPGSGRTILQESSNVIDVGLGLKRSGSREWRRIVAQSVLPRIASFKPDIIFISAGFDAHVRDDLNCGFVGLKESDYMWITSQLANIACTAGHSRIVSVLEGGYKIHGRHVSPFARSVAAHVRQLTDHERAIPYDVIREQRQLVEERTEFRRRKEEKRRQREERIRAQQNEVRTVLSETDGESLLQLRASKRRRGDGGAKIDYVELDRQLREESEAAKNEKKENKED